MKEAGFFFSDRASSYEKAREDPSIRAMRADFLERIRQYRRKGKDIYYQDETWLSKNMTAGKVWTHEILGAQFAAPSGAGGRSIISHVGGSRSGLLRKALLIYRGAQSPKSADYHSEMNSQVFNSLLSERILPSIREESDRAVLVLDRAPYHSVMTDFTRRATEKMKKDEVSSRLESWGGPPAGWPSDWRREKKKAQILQAAKLFRPHPVYISQQIAATFGVEILFLPVSHP